jgi:hypothetical protein
VKQKKSKPTDLDFLSIRHPISFYLISANLKINYKMINKKERGESNFFLQIDFKAAEKWTKSR